jgi:prepilin-type N-terminal cleavage/methylation domain-containing protein
MSKRNKGFTLIELLVVIAIIGILASIVLASLNSARKKSRDARRIADLKQVQLALEMYFDSNSNYPAAATWAALGTLIAPTYIAAIPIDPLNTDNYVYKYAALGSGTSCTSYHLGATLEETTNPAFNSDIDAAAGTACTGGGTDFAGGDVIYCGGSAGTDACYDVKP